MLIELPIRFEKREIYSPMWLAKDDIFVFVTFNGDRASNLCKMTYDNDQRGWKFVTYPGGTVFSDNSQKKFNEKLDRIVVIWRG